MTTDKEFLTLRAQAAMQGLRVERVLGNAGRLFYIVIRNGRAIDCADLDSVRTAMLRLAGALR